MFVFEGVLQNDDCGLGVDDLSALTRVLPCGCEGVVGFDSGEALIDEADRRRRGSADPLRELKAVAAAARADPSRDFGSPMSSSIGSYSSMISRSVFNAAGSSVRLTTVSGVARMPSGSLAATPMRTEPMSRPNRRPRRKLTGELP